MKKPDISIVDSDKALSFWEGSPHASVFTHPDVLWRLAARVDWWLCSGTHPLCLWPVCQDENAQVILPDFTYYVGPMWSSFGMATPNNRWLVKTSAVYKGFIEEFSARYGTIKASLPLGLSDVRIFDWWNYHDKLKPRFEIRPRYTACIEELQERSIEDIFSSFRKVRRRICRRFEEVQDRFTLVSDCTLDELIALYHEVLGRNFVKVETETVRNIGVIFKLIHDGFGFIVGLRDSACADKLAYIALLLVAKGTANHVLNLVANDYRESSLMVWGTFQSISKAKELGCQKLDFNGVNSPQRGDDNHSYGASARLYFEIQYQQRRSSDSFSKVK